MNNTLHTPGPWHVVRSSAHNNPQTTRKDILGQSQFGPAYVAGDISEIDAHLISAAPDLLEALQECVRVLAEYTQYDDDDGSAEGNARLLGLAAIAKAKGEA